MPTPKAKRPRAPEYPTDAPVPPPWAIAAGSEIQNLTENFLAALERVRVIERAINDAPEDEPEEELRLLSRWQTESDGNADLLRQAVVESTLLACGEKQGQPWGPCAVMTPRDREPRFLVAIAPGEAGGKPLYEVEAATVIVVEWERVLDLDDPV